VDKDEQRNGVSFRNDIETSMIYTHVLNGGGRGVRSPADALRMEGLTRKPCKIPTSSDTARNP
jgi:hypothetical protein